MIKGWDVKKEGSKVTYSIYQSKAKAITQARALIEKVGVGSIIVANSSGRLSSVHNS